MATDYDPLKAIIDLLNANYDNAKADNIDPTISKIYEKPTEKEPRPGEDFIYVYSVSTQHASSGMGNTTVASTIESIRIDIRSRPSNASQSSKTTDTHARKVLTEVKNVLFGHITSPGSGFDFIDPNISYNDLSNGMRGIFRYVIDLNLNDTCRDMTA